MVSENFALWGRYPPMVGSPEFRRAVVDWFGNVLVMRGGRVIDKGSFDDLKDKDGELKSLLQSE